MLTSIRNVKLYKTRKFIMFITAVCVNFLIKPYDGPRTKVFLKGNMFVTHSLVFVF